jgi:hypothetical protein
MRWAIGILAALATISVAGGLGLLLADPASRPLGLKDGLLNAPVLALGLVFFAVVLERAAVVLSFLHSRRTDHAGWSLILVSLCLLIMLDSLFFTLRVKGLLHESWTLLQLPAEEASPPLEALLLAVGALMYAVCCGGEKRSQSTTTQPDPLLPPMVA